MGKSKTINARVPAILYHDLEKEAEDNKIGISEVIRKRLSINAPLKAKKLTDSLDKQKNEHERLINRHQKELENKDDEIFNLQVKLQKEIKNTLSKVQNERVDLEKRYEEMLDRKDEQIRDLNKLLDQEQKLHLATQNDRNQKQIELESYENKKWWKFWK